MKVAIGFTGVKQSGKTTSFNFLKDLFGGIQEIAFADKLKNTCAIVFDIPRDAFDSSTLKEKELDVPVTLTPELVTRLIQAYGLPFNSDIHVRPHSGQVLYTPRQIAQYVGTEILRNVDTEIHCKGATVGLQDGVYVFTDMRFPNEYEHLQDTFGSNFYPFYINNLKAEAKAALDSHASEKHILDIGRKCTKIDNNGSLEDLRAKVLDQVGSLLLDLNKNFIKETA